MPVNARLQIAVLLPQKEALEAEVNEINAKQLALTAKPPATDEEKSVLSGLKVELAKKSEELDRIKKNLDVAKAGLDKPTSEGFFKDILTDANGTSFHRFQMLIWTIVLGFLFCVGVYKSLAMPEFSVTLLALMGISAGTYLGFKIPEQQT